MGEIQPGAVRTAAGTIEQVARTVRVHIPDEVGGIASALAGSASGAAGTALATAWTDAYVAWAADAEAHAQKMRDAADAWDGTNQRVATHLDRNRMTAV